jgi:hypothetical protein
MLNVLHWLVKTALDDLNVTVQTDILAPPFGRNLAMPTVTASITVQTIPCYKTNIYLTDLLDHRCVPRAQSDHFLLAASH